MLSQLFFQQVMRTLKSDIWGIACLSAPGATHEEDVENGMMGGKTQEEREVDRLMEMKRGEEELTLEKYLDIVGGMRPEFLEDESMRETLVAYYFRKNAEGDGRHGLVGDGEVADLEDATVMDDSQAVVKPSSGQKVMKDL